MPLGSCNSVTERNLIFLRGKERALFSDRMLIGAVVVSLTMWRLLKAKSLKDKIELDAYIECLKPIFLKIIFYLSELFFLYKIGKQ